MLQECKNLNASIDLNMIGAGMGASKWQDASGVWHSNGTAVGGLLSDDPAVAGTIAGWNAIWVHYCDGTSFTGDRLEPANNGSLFYRGRYILDALLVDLETRFGFMTRTDTSLVLGGCSAGGLAVNLHAAYIRSKLHTAATMVAIPDAGFFADLPNTKGVRTWGLGLRAAAGFGPALPPLPGKTTPLVRVWNASRSIMPACLDRHTDDPFACFFPETALPFVTQGNSGYDGAPAVRTLVINSLFDAFQEGAIWGTGCGLADASRCNASQFLSAGHYRDALLEKIQGASPSGYFLTSCSQHEQACRDFDVTTIRAGNTTMATAVAKFLAGSSGSDVEHVNAAGSEASLGPGWPGDGSCRFEFGHPHGWC